MSWPAIEQAVLKRDQADISWLEPLLQKEWTLSGGVLQFLSALLDELRPGRIVEFGSGLSTRLFARYAMREGGCLVTAIDHDPDYAVNPVLEHAAFSGVHRLLTPVVVRGCGGKLLPVYRMDEQQSAALRGAELILIDGPPTTLGGREGALYQALDLAATGGVLVLDDAGRSSEREAADCFLQNVGASMEWRYLHGFPKGLAVGLVKNPVALANLWQHRLELSLRELSRGQNSRGKTVILDQGWWEWERADGRLRRLLERDGCYWGEPADAAEAISALAEAVEYDSVTRLAVGWPCAWWRQSYPAFWTWVAERFESVLANDRLEILALRPR